MPDWDDIYRRVEEMSEADRQALDGICEAITDCRLADTRPYKILANRVVSLACVDLYNQWQREMFESNG